MTYSAEVNGHIIKEENIDVLKHHIVPNSLVINVDHPFPGYHGLNYNFQTKPRSIIIATEKPHSWEKILRANDEIRKTLKNTMNATFSKIKIGNQIIYGIRIKGIDSYDEIPEIQKAFSDKGFKLLYKKRIKTDKPASIKISKFFCISAMDEQIYKDGKVQNMYYIEIPKYLGWECFRSITETIKNNISNNNFDVVKGVFFKDSTVKEMIRVYKPNMSLELLKEIKDKYHKEIQKV